MGDRDDIIDLQSRVAFQEDVIQEVTRQLSLCVGELADAKKQIKMLSKKLNDIQSVMDDGQGSDTERPPHY